MFSRKSSTWPKRSGFKKALALTLCMVIILSFTMTMFTGSFAEAGRAFPEWTPGTAYSAGDLVSYGGVVYKCIQPHTALQGWEPNNVASLWELQKDVQTPTQGATNTPTPTKGNTVAPTVPNGNKVSGYVKPDLASTDSNIMAGFKVELVGTNLSGVTDASGYFEIINVPQNTYSLKLSKVGYLSRTGSITVVSGVTIGSQAAPVDVWFGDILTDDVINMADVMEISKAFNSVQGDSKYIADCDANKDGAVNMSDVMILVKHFNKTTADYPAISNITTPTPPQYTNTPTNTLKPATPTKGPDTGKKFVAYYPNWLIYGLTNQELYKYFVQDMPWSKIDFVNYAFAKITNGKIGIFDSYADIECEDFPLKSGLSFKGNFNQLVLYKEKYPNVKTLISVGGWTLSGNFSDVALTDTSRTTFANSCVDFVRKYKFDGVDIDWEYPAAEGAPGNVIRPEDKHNFTLLLQKMREVLDAAGSSDGHGHYYLTIAAPAGESKIAGQEPDLYHPYLDFINLMTYDYHGNWDSVTGHLAPLYKNPDDPGEATFYIDWSVNKYLSLNVPANKLNLGMPYYSRGWKGVKDNGGSLPGLFQPGNDGAPGISDDPSAPEGNNPIFYIKEKYEVAGSGYTKYRDPYTKTPYLFNPSLGYFYTYDDDEAIAAKCDYLNSKGLGGAMVWDITNDYPYKGSTLTNLINSKIK